MTRKNLTTAMINTNKIFLLAFLLLIGVGNAWADDDVIFEYKYTDGSKPAISAGDISQYGTLSHGKSIKAFGTVDGSTAGYIKLGTNAGGIEIELDNSIFQEGDVVIITGKNGGSDERSFAVDKDNITIANDETYLPTDGYSSQTEDHDFSVTLTSAWLNGYRSSKLHIFRKAGNSMYFKGVKVTRAPQGPKLNVNYFLQTNEGLQPTTVAGYVDKAGKSFAEGTLVEMTATANYGYEFTHWGNSVGGTIENGTNNPYSFEMGPTDVTYSAVFSSHTVYALTAKLADAAQGTITFSPDYKTYTGGEDTPPVYTRNYEEGTSVTVTAQPKSGWKFSKWTTDDGTEVLSSDATYTFSMPAESKTIRANFLPSFRMSFVKGSDAGIKGNVYMTEGFADEEGNFTLPSKNVSLYKEGYTQTGWSTEDNGAGTVYALGATMTGITANTTLYPVFTENRVALGDRASDLTLRWNWQTSVGDPAMAYNRTTGYYVTQATIDGYSIDVPLEINATSGKLDNTGNTNWAQVGNGLLLTVPSSKDATVWMHVYNEISSTTIDNATLTESQLASGNNKYTYTINGTNLSTGIHVAGDIQYIRTLTVTLPQLTANTLSVEGGSEIITLNPDMTHKLTKGTDYRTNSDGNITYSSSDESVASVSADGTITAGNTFGNAVITLHQQSTGVYAGKSVSFVVKVISAYGQTASPLVSVSPEGTVTITKNPISGEGTKIYYTTNGETPTKDSPEYTTPLSGLSSPLKVVAIDGGKSPSDIVVAYANVSGTFTWSWDSGTPVRMPAVSGNVSDAIEEGTGANWGSKLINFTPSSDPNPTYIKFGPKDNKSYSNNPEFEASISYLIIPKTGIQFLPSTVSFHATRIGTDQLNIKAVLRSGSREYELLEQTMPNRIDAGGEQAFIYTTSDKLADVVASDDEWELIVYLYHLQAMSTQNKYLGINNIVIDGTFRGANETVRTYSVTASSIPDIAGTVTRVPRSTMITAGKSVVFTAKPNVGYKFSHWTYYEEEDVLSNEPTFRVDNVSTSAAYQAHFLPLPRAMFSCSVAEVKGTAPAVEYADAVTGKVYIPRNMTLYREGYTLTAWTDGNVNYLPGEEYAITEDISLTPVFTKNKYMLTDIESPVTLRWQFDNLAHPKDVPGYEKDNDTHLPFVKQVTVQGEPIDVEMYINTNKNGTGDEKGGKFTNIDNRVNSLPGEGAQCNDYCKMFFPSVPGMSVTLKSSTKRDDTTFTYWTAGETVPTTFNGETVLAEDEHTARYDVPANSENTTLTIMYKQPDGKGTYGFYEYVEITYPVLPDVQLQNVISSEKLHEGEQARNAGTITKSETTHAIAGTRYLPGDEVTISVTAGYGYTITSLTCNNGELRNITIPEGGATASATYVVGSATGVVTATYERKPTVAVVVNTDDMALGHIDLVKVTLNTKEYAKDSFTNFFVDNRNSDGSISCYMVEGSLLQVTSEAAMDYVIDEWKVNGGSLEPKVTTNTYTYTVGAEAAIVTAFFRLGETGSASFSLGGTGAVGTLPQNVVDGHSFSIPKYYAIYKEEDGKRKSLTHWSGNDGNTYEIGKTYSFASQGQNITLTPVFEDVRATLENRINSPVYFYDFRTEAKAQSIDAGSNVSTYWNTHVYVESMVLNEKVTQSRDAEVRITTGPKGFIRNTAQKTWCAMGEGTTLSVPSCYGATVTLLCYAPVSSTTIEGEQPQLVQSVFVPQLGETVTTNPDKHIYVYSHKVKSAGSTIDIVIGKDYAYYKWLQINALEADRAVVHAKADDNVMVGDFVVGTENMDYPGELQDDGGMAFRKGISAYVTATRSFGYQITEWKDAISGQRLAWLNAAGTAYECAPGYRVTENGKVKTLAIDDISDHLDITVYAKPIKTYYVTYNSGKQAAGASAPAAWVEPGDEYTIPRNQSLYYEGHTLKYYQDKAGTRYDIGSTYTFPAVDPQDILLYPVFETNAFTLLDLEEQTTVRWPLSRNEGASLINFEGADGFVVAQMRKGEDWIDMKLDLKAKEWEPVPAVKKRGKFNNVNDPNRCQINEYSRMLFPTTSGCEIGLSAVNTIADTRICGKNATEDKAYEAGKVISYTYNGNDAQGDVLFANDGRYYQYFEVTYKPIAGSKPSLTALSWKKGVTVTPLTAEQITELTTNGTITIEVGAPDYDGDAMPQVEATVANGKAVVTQATVNTKSANILLQTIGGITAQAYGVQFHFSDTHAPRLLKIAINGREVENHGTMDDVPVNGKIEFTFDHTMAAYASGNFSSPQGKTMTFNYWDLAVNTTVVQAMPLNALQDIYGTPFSEDVSVTLHTVATPIEYNHTKFNFIVGRDGTIDDALAAANRASGTDRFYIFVPDGEHELTGNELTQIGITSDNKYPCDSLGVERKDLADGGPFNNRVNKITRQNVSIVGQSQTGTIIYNRPLVEGISYTGTIHMDKTAVDGYFQDITLENRFPYVKSMAAQSGTGAARAVAFWDQGNRQILKNVSLLSWQDTYYSNNAGEGYRGYFEDCKVAGVVDFICGDGDIWFENTELMLRDRAGNNIAAPRTDVSQPWGYVMNNCQITVEEGSTLVQDKSYTLGRPWNGVPGCTYLNTKMAVLPRDAGWQGMQEGFVIHFHEYKSTDSEGHEISLGARTLAACSPQVGSDDPILSDAEAAGYTKHNVLGGGDAFDPTAYTLQCGVVENLGFDDEMMQWTHDESALCYFVFKQNTNTGKWEYLTDVVENSLNIEQLDGGGEGWYIVRAANQRGGLGAATQPIYYTAADSRTIKISKVGAQADPDTPTGWSTICLPFNARNPEPEKIRLYAVTQVEGRQMTLVPVDAITAGRGYVLFGEAGEYTFKTSSHTAAVETILDGNPSDAAISRTVNCYTLANKETLGGIGFYKYEAATLAALKAWLSVDRLTPAAQALAASKGLSMMVLNGDEATLVEGVMGAGVADGDADGDDGKPIYNLAGMRVKKHTRGIVIRSGSKFAK